MKKINISNVIPVNTLSSQPILVCHPSECWDPEKDHGLDSRFRGNDKERGNDKGRWNDKVKEYYE